jgi:dihydropteroate synthase
VIRPGRANADSSGPSVGARTIALIASTAGIYLRPLGVLRGEAARDAVEAGFALPLGDPDGGFTAAEIWQRAAGRVERCTLPVAELASWARRRGQAVEAALSRRLAAATQPCSWPRSLPDRRPLIMGVVNVTPDSFSDGGRFLEPALAIAHGHRLHAEGADIVDVGGESTRPGAAPVPAAEEMRRVLPVIEALAASGIVVSIDSRNAAVMRAAIAAGARMINDVSALSHDPASLEVAGGSDCPVVLMHSQGEPPTMQRQPTYACAPLDVFDHLEQRILAWVARGFERDRLLIDPGIGFGKTLAHNVEILSRLGLFLGLGVPILLGVSRKSFLARLAEDAPPSERLPGSLAAALAGVMQGIAVVRVHDVAATRQCVRIWQALSC